MSATMTPRMSCRIPCSSCGICETLSESTARSKLSPSWWSSARSLNLLRDKGAVPRAALEECADDVPSGEDILIGRQKAEYVDGILASLPDSMQTLIRLRHIEGYDNAAIAAITGSSEGAVRTALSRARRKVATLFNINEIN